MHSKKILVLGQGLLGTEITKQTNWSYLSRKDHKFNICNFENFKKTMLNYDTIVNCIANTNTYSESKEEHWSVNYKAVYDLCLFCKDNNIKLVHISSDFVYANNSIVEPSELQPPIPSENWYSVTKLLADCVIELVCDNYLILRCTHKNFPFPYNEAFVDRIGNFDYTNVIADIIIKMIEKNAQGLFNIGTEKKSIYELAVQSNKNVKKVCSPNNVPKDTSMDLTKMKELLSS